MCLKPRWKVMACEPVGSANTAGLWPQQDAHARRGELQTKPDVRGPDLKWTGRVLSLSAHGEKGDSFARLNICIIASLDCSHSRITV